MKQEVNVAITPPAAQPKRPPTAQTRQLQQIAAIWNALSTNDQFTWKALAGQMNPTRAIGAKPKVGAYALFVQHALGQIKSGGAPHPVAASYPVPPVPLPGIAAAATFGPYNCFGLVITPAAAYPNRVIIYAARPLLAGNNTYSDKAFKIIGHLDILTATPTDISDLYAAHWRVPGTSYEVALKFVGISSSGFRTPASITTAVVHAPAQQAALPGDPHDEGSEDMTLLKAA